MLGAIYIRTGNILGSIIAHAWWDLPYFLTLGAGVSGGSADAGMPTMALSWDGLWGFWMWLLVAVYGLWLVRPGTEVFIHVDTHSRHSPAIFSR